MLDRAYPRQEQPRRGTLGWGDYDSVMEVTARAVEGGDYLLGDQFTAADVVVGFVIRWGLKFKLMPDRREFASYSARLKARPALQRAEALDEELARAS